MTRIAVALVLACLAVAPKPSPAGGTSVADAIVLDATSETAGVGAEYAYVRGLTCANEVGVYRVTQQAMLNEKDRAYDVLHLKCSVGTETRAIYFDITSFFGKM